MSRDRAMPTPLAAIDPRTRTPVRTMLLLIVLGLVLIFASSFLPTAGTIMTDSVNAVAVQVCYYYGLSGLACAWAYRDARASAPGQFVLYAVYPFLSAVALILLGLYAIASFDTLTKIVGVGGLLGGIIFYRPRRWGTPAAIAIPAE